MSELAPVLHQLGELLVDPSLGNGSNLGYAKVADLLHMLGDAVAVGGEDLEKIVADIETLHKNHGLEPAKGFWDKLVEKGKQVDQFLTDQEQSADNPNAPADNPNAPADGQPETDEMIGQPHKKKSKKKE